MSRTTTKGKPSAARTKLDEIEVALAEVAGQEAKVRARITEAEAKAAGLRAELADRIAAGGPVGLDVTADDMETRTLHGDLARAESEAQGGKWKATLAGLQRRRERLESERTLQVRDNLDALVAELAAEAATVRERLDAALAEVDAVRGEWGRLAGAWLALERAGHLQSSMRLDIPDFPVKVGDLADPVPRILADVVEAA